MEAESPAGQAAKEGEERLARSLERIEGLCAQARSVRAEIAKTIVGQDRVVEEILIALLAGGHVLLEGVPGLAKTLLVSTVARVTSLTFSRIQFTPDLMPADITGSQVIQSARGLSERRLHFRRGPLFAGVVLADEINRTPPRTQAALLEAMQEGQVTAGGIRHPLPSPFFVLATQNPIEQEGTYPLPEAQRDRFLFHVVVDYPTLEEERGIVRKIDVEAPPEPGPVISGEDILALRRIVRALPVSEPLLRYAAQLARSSRPDDALASPEVERWVAWGAGPRAPQALILAAKARALLAGRYAVTRADLRSVALPALRHRIIPNFRAEAEGMTTDELVKFIIGAAPGGIPPESRSYDGRTQKLLRF
jgi:MoxR-like ATPase